MSFTNALSNYRIPFKENKILWFCSIIFLTIWASTLIGTTDLKNWILENFLVFISLFLIIWNNKKYQFSDLSFVLFTVYICLHIYGSKYTYAENPFGYWLKDILHLERNHYDRIVHFSFGFLLAYPMREAFISWFKFPTWVGWLLPIEITLSFSGLYELVEWAVADVFFPEQGIAYLGTQGDIWDAQKDMFLATLGAVLATSIISGLKKVLKFY
jgi:putative membrane protein